MLITIHIHTHLKKTIISCGRKWSLKVQIVFEVWIPWLIFFSYQNAGFQLSSIVTMAYESLKTVCNCPIIRIEILYYDGKVFEVNTVFLSECLPKDKLQNNKGLIRVIGLAVTSTHLLRRLLTICDLHGKCTVVRF